MGPDHKKPDYMFPGHNNFMHNDGDCCCDPHDHHDVYGKARTPVQIERILVPYRNPDGTPSKGKYYQYPITCFEAIHLTKDIHSANLNEIIEKWEALIKDRQKEIGSGSENAILTRGKTDGQLRELTKIDYPEPKRMSKTHVPSEHCMFKAIALHREDIAEDIKKETMRAVATEDSLRDEIRSEAHRALSAEAGLSDMIGAVEEGSVSKSIFGDGEYILQNLSHNFSDLSAVKWCKTMINVQTGSKDTKTGSFDMLKQVTEKVDAHIKDSAVINGKVNASEFDSTDGTTVAKLDFTYGKGGSFIGAVSMIVKNIKGAAADIKKVLNFRSNTLRGTISDISSTERELNIEVIYASDDEVGAMLKKVYA